MNMRKQKAAADTDKKMTGSKQEPIKSELKRMARRHQDKDQGLRIVATSPIAD